MKTILILALTSTDLFAATYVADIQQTNTQAVIHVSTDQDVNCTYRISEANTFLPLVHDIDGSLFPGSDSDARPGSIVNGSDHWFVAGTRTSAKATDGRFYSRALAANTLHYGGVTCGADAEVSFTFTTNNIFTGNTFADPIPFDAGALGNYAIPTVDYTNQLTDYIDPEKGLKFKLATLPGQYTWGANILTAGLLTTYSPGSVDGAILTATNWTNTANCLQVDGGLCTYTAAAQDILTIRLAATKGPGGESGNYNWQNTIGNPGQFHALGIDALQANLSGNGGGSSIKVDVALSWNGVDQASEWATVTLPAATGLVSYPASLAGLLAAWQGPNYPPVPGTVFELTQVPLQVNTNGPVVTAVNNSGYFPLDQRLLKAGSRITIAGTEYTIASVDSATQVTLTASAGTHANASAFISNFAVMIRKHDPAPGTINLDGVTLTMAVSAAFTNGGSGFQQACSSVSAADSAGHKGRFCIFAGLNSALYWITDDLESHFIGRAFLPASSIGVTADEYTGGFYGGQSLFDATDPNSWYVSSTLRSNGSPTLVKATYHPAGVAGCATGADYQTMPRPADWSNTLDNCSITYTEITRPSQGKDIYTQLKPALKSGKFGMPGLSFIQNGVAVFLVNGGSQDTEAWTVLVRLSDGMVTGQFSTYMNSPPGSCRFCVLHAPLPSNAGDTYFGMYFNDYAFDQPTGGTTNGDGPYLLTVSTALTTTPGNATCSGVTDPAVAWLIPYSDGCDDITLSASDNIPCDPDPSKWEAANAGACSWHSGWSQWQGGAIQVGDRFQDPNTGYEIMVFAKHLAGSRWTVLRNINPPHGYRMEHQAGINPEYLRAHASGWSASMHCNFAGNAFVSTAETDGSGLIWDRKFTGFNHAVLRHAGITSAELFYDVAGAPSGLSVKSGQFPGMANKPETYRLLNNPPFSGKAGPVAGYVQSHVGWLSTATSLTDMCPLAPGAGGSFGLWPQTGVTQVTGTLYKIPRASAYVAADKRRRPLMVWSGMYNMKDVSGAGIDGTADHNWHYCSIDYAGSTCGQAGESVGDVYLNIRQLTLDGYTGGAFDVNRANVAPLGMETIAAVQYYFADLLSYSGMSTNDGRHERRLTTALGRYGAQDTYSNAKIIEGSNVLTFTCSTPNLQRVEDICIAKMPPDPPAEAGNDFLVMPVTVPGGHLYAEVQFGYAEFGAAGSFYCTTRQEACNTSSPVGTPFNWEGEARQPTACSAGCNVKMPVLPDHVVYYRTRTSDDGTTWTNGATQAAVAPSGIQ